MLTTLAFGLATSMPLASSPGQAGPRLELTIDACVDADRQEVVRLLEVEIGGAIEAIEVRPEASPALPAVRRIIITCTSEPDIVRLTDPASPESSARILDLRALGAVARKARAREMALVIRELLAAPQEPAASDVPKPPAVAAPRAARSLAQLSLLGGAEKYSGGYAQLGAKIGLRLTPVRLLVLEARLGAGIAPTIRAPAGAVEAGGFVGGLGVGLDIFPAEAAAGLVLLCRVESAWVTISGTSDRAGTVGRSASGFALVASVAPSAWLALGNRWQLILEPALLFPIKELSIAERGRPVSSISGIGAAAGLGLSLKL